MNINFLLLFVIFLNSYYGFKNTSWKYKMSLHPYSMDKNIKEYYRIFTSGLVHADWRHLIFNALTLYFFGNFMASYMGFLGYMTLFFGGVVFGNLSSIIKFKNDKNYYSLGASGGISALLMAYIIAFPTSKIYFFFALPIPAYIFGLLFFIFSIYAHFKLKDGINHLAHLTGGVFGVLWILFQMI